MSTFSGSAGFSSRVVRTAEIDSFDFPLAGGEVAAGAAAAGSAGAVVVPLGLAFSFSSLKFRS